MKPERIKPILRDPWVIAIFGGAVAVVIGSWIGTQILTPHASPNGLGASAPSPTVSPGSLISSPGPVYIETLALTPPPDGKGQAVMDKPYNHSVWYNRSGTLQIVIPVQGKYKFFNVDVGTTQWWAYYDIQADGYTLVGKQVVQWGGEPHHHYYVDISGRQSVTIDVEAGADQVVVFVLGTAKLLT